MSLTITAPLAPLTTVFTPPCPISWLLTSSKKASQFPPFPTTGPSSCDPPSWAANIADRGFQYYSPAICPSGFEVGPGCQITKTRTAEGFPAVEPDETAAYCVPSGFTCTTDTTDFRGGVWGATQEAGSPLFTAGPALQIRFQESDLSLLETHPLTPGLTLAGLPAKASVVATATAGPGSGDPTAATATFGQFQTIPTPTTTPVIAGTPSQPPTETSRADPPAVPSNMTIASNPTTTATAVPSNEKTAGSKGQSSTSIAAIVLSTLLTIFALAFTVYACLKGRCRSFCTVSTDRRKGLRPVGVGVWIGTRGSDEEVAYGRPVDAARFSTPEPPTLNIMREPRSSMPPRTRPSIPPRTRPSIPPRTRPSIPPRTRSSMPQRARPSMPWEATRSTMPRRSTPPEVEGGVRIPIFRQALDQRARAIKVPAAELDDSQEGTPSRHGSWVSRVSRMLSRAARSSATSRSSSRSRSRSGWTTLTARGPADGEEWEHFIQGGRGGVGPGGLTVPNLTYTRPASTASGSSSSSSSSFSDDGLTADRKDDHHFFDLEGAPRRLPKIDSFDRLSEGTFGMRGRSSDRSAKRKS